MPDTRLTSRALAAARGRVSSALRRALTITPLARRDSHPAREMQQRGTGRDHGLMRVLVTGDRGSVGVPVAAFLRRAGWEIAGFDLASGADVLDPPALRRAARGCDQLFQRAGVRDRRGERLPDYFPVDDAHPRRAARPYGLSKLLGEDLCAGFTSRTGIATVCLRPVAVWDQARYGQVRDQWRARPRSEWEPYWEYGAFVDVRDVAAAVGQALTVPRPGSGQCSAP